MGYSARVSIINNSSHTVKVSVDEQRCMQNDGLNYFNGLTIAPNETKPSADGEWVQADNSGVCSFSPSSFRLKIDQKGDKKTVQFEDHSNRNWGYKSEVEWISPYVNNGGSHAIIRITITNK